MKVGICEWNAAAGGEAMFQRLQRVGLSGVQVSYEANGFLEKMQQYVEWGKQYGVTLTSVGANVFCEKPLFLPENEALLREVVADVARGATLTAGRLFHVPAFGASHLHSEADYRHMVTALQIACDVAAKWGVRAESENVLSVAENRQLIKDVARPNFGIYFDTQNSQMSEHHDAAAHATAFGADFFEVHVKDCAENGEPIHLGDGVSAAEETVTALMDGGFNGWFILENGYGGDTAEDAMKADIAWLRSVTCKN